MASVNKKVYEAILAINKLLEDYISGVSFYSTMDKFLKLLLETTNSENGFIGTLSGPNRQFFTIVCNIDSEEVGYSLGRLQQCLGAITLDKTVTNYYDCTSLSLRSFTSVPLEFDGKLIGYIGLTNKPASYSSSDFEILRFAKNNISSILNHQQNINVQHSANRRQSTSQTASIQSRPLQ